MEGKTETSHSRLPPGRFQFHDAHSEECAKACVEIEVDDNCVEAVVEVGDERHRVVLSRTDLTGVDALSQSTVPLAHSCVTFCGSEHGNEEQDTLCGASRDSVAEAASRDQLSRFCRMGLATKMGSCSFWAGRGGVGALSTVGQWSTAAMGVGRE